jgi:hypothetical protein
LQLVRLHSGAKSSRCSHPCAQTPSASKMLQVTQVRCTPQKAHPPCWYRLLQLCLQAATGIACSSCRHVSLSLARSWHSSCSNHGVVVSSLKTTLRLKHSELAHQRQKCNSLEVTMYGNSGLRAAVFFAEVT